MSDRHLRRMFTDQIGATPDQLARSRRAHFARRLLDDTDLRIAEVAFAAGFGSLRQFNRTMTTTFHATPQELRKRRRRTDRLVADGGLALRVPLARPRPFEQILARLAAGAIPGLEQVTAVHYRRTVTLDGDPGVIEISSAGADEIQLVAHLPRLEGLIHFVEQVQRLLVGDGWNTYEAGVRDIVANNVGRSAAREILGNIVEQYGMPLSGLRSFELSRLFPTPGVLATADLRTTGLDSDGAQAVRKHASGSDRVRDITCPAM
ncbi:helix-turn-helix domain-containing protein [Nocardia sp. NPDC020380]|uniref:helix-turn-helix domain-containing protein n=1 Tax=Nocardia sp. NPDC020380 TaxID=3364309 RepID=UPI00378C1A8E